ncbi:hypothetical protein WA158_008442 [Blastocystis sp. Blastoise]
MSDISPISSTLFQAAAVGHLHEECCTISKLSDYNNDLLTVTLDKETDEPNRNLALGRQDGYKIRYNGKILQIKTPTCVVLYEFSDFGNSNSKYLVCSLGTENKDFVKLLEAIRVDVSHKIFEKIHVPDSVNDERGKLKLNLDKELGNESVPMHAITQQKTWQKYPMNIVSIKIFKNTRNQLAFDLYDKDGKLINNHYNPIINTSNCTQYISALDSAIAIMKLDRVKYYDKEWYITRGLKQLKILGSSLDYIVPVNEIDD